MSDIFISYKREDQATARKLADALESEGWTVWWDPKLRTGEIFDDVIEKALTSANCVVVLWSEGSVKSQYVRDEATYALERNKLVPVAIEAVEMPFRFRGVQTLRLFAWDGSRDSSGYRKFVDDISAILSRSGEIIPDHTERAEEKRLREQERQRSEEETKQKADEKSKGSWWQTVPGILIGLAGIITAVAGLIVVLHQYTPSPLGPGSSIPKTFVSPAGTERQRPEIRVTPPAVERPYNLSFDMLPVGNQPPGWFNSAGFVGDVSTAYEIRVVPRPDGGNGACVLFQNPRATQEEFGSLMQRFLALDLASKTIRLEGEIKTKNVAQWAGLWLRADDDDGNMLFFDNMEKRPIRGTTSWTKYVIQFPLPSKTVWLNYGILLVGRGMMWADNFRFMVWNRDKGEWIAL
jgi:TIR domain